MEREYIFFDVECCDGHHVCSFGYTLTDAKLNVIEKRDVLINPEKPFQKGRGGFNVFKILAYSEAEFRAAPPFPALRETIARLLTENGRVVAGHAVSNDFNFLLRACERYGLTAPEAEFFDVQTLFAHVSGTPDKRVSLNKITEALGIPDNPCEHKSDDDADTVREILKKLCANARVSNPLKLLRQYPQCAGYARGGEVYIYTDNLVKIFKTFIRRFTPSDKLFTPDLDGARVYFCVGLEKVEPLKLWTLCERLIERGAVYTENPAASDIFVWDGNESASDYKFIKRNKNFRGGIINIRECAALAGLKWENVTEHFTDRRYPIKNGARSADMPQGGRTARRLNGARTSLAEAFAGVGERLSDGANRKAN